MRKKSVHGKRRRFAQPKTISDLDLARAYYAADAILANAGATHPRPVGLTPCDPVDDLFSRSRLPRTPMAVEVAVF